MRIVFSELKETVKKALVNAGLTEEQAEVCAGVHAESSRDGVYSHGLNRVPVFAGLIKKGWVDVNGEPELLRAKGCAENYDGHLGIGVINARHCMKRAVELAKVHGVGVVSLRNTTHWQRGGTYVWDAADAGYMSICWTNTESNMLLWGAKEAATGNNPFCVGIPHKTGHIVLDMALSQFSYGKLQVTRLAGKELPVDGGYDLDGNLTKDPGAIEDSQQLLPMGYWKGSGLSVVLDLAAAVLSGGKTAADMDETGKNYCTSCCQVFIAFDPYLFSDEEEVEQSVQKLIDHIHDAEPLKAGKRPSYPGERTRDTRAESMELGVEVDEDIWAQVQKMAKQ